MNKIIKYGLIGTGALAGVAVAGAAYLAVTFDPNDYKDRIVKAVKDRTQRDLRLDGTITLSLFPRIGANIGKVSLSEFNSGAQFAAIDSARVSLALLPLFSGQAVVDEVALSGLQATLLKRKDGTTNIDDLLGTKAGEEKPAAQEAGAGQTGGFDIAAVSIEKTSLTYRDEGSGAQYAIKDLNLHTGRIANGMPGRIDLSATVQSNQPKVDLNTLMKATLTFDLDARKFRVEGLDLQANGTALDIGDLKLKASGDADADLDKHAFGAQKFLFGASGKQGENHFEATLEAPGLSLVADAISGDKLALGIGVKQPAQAFEVKLDSPLSGNLKARQFNLDKLAIALHATGEKLPGKSISSEMLGGVQVDAAQETVRANLAGGLLQSQVKATLGVNGFADPAISFDVEIDQFDADLYLPKKAEGAVKPDVAKPEQPLDLSALRKLKLDGSLRIGALKVANVRSSNVRLDVKARDGRVDVAPLSANLYEGSMKGSLNVNAAPATPVISVNQTLSGVNIAALTKDAADFDTLEGKGSIGMNLAMQGATTDVMKKSLNGTLSLNLADGAIKGINIAKTMREFGKGSAAKTQGANKEEKTDFSELKASFKVKAGVAHNDDLSLKSPLLRLTGNGDIDIGNDSINYVAKATLAKTLEGQGGKDTVGGITVPVRVSGPFDGLKYTLDFGAMVSEATKQKIETKKEKIKSKLKGGLKGLLK